MTAALLPRALGPAFERLPFPIRAMHTEAEPRVAIGRGDVTLGHGWLARLLAACLHLPAEGRDQPLTVWFTPTDGRERWTRRFGRHAFTSLLGPRADGVLVERAGPLAVAMRPVAAPAGLTLERVRVWFCGVPLPAALAPRFTARIRAPECLYRFEVAISLPLVGELIRYAGWLAPPRPLDG